MTILSLSLTAIFASEVEAIRVGARAHHVTVASLLARCKMGEIEEQMLNEGFPAVREDGEDACCEDGEHEGFECEWVVERVELPDAIDTGAEGALGGLGGDHAGDSAGAGDMEAALTGAAGGDAVGALAVEAAFPVIRPFIEEQVRRATVTVHWGDRDDEDRQMAVTQYLVAPQGQATPGEAPP